MPQKPKKKGGNTPTTVACPCVACSKEVEDGDKSLQCDMCDEWCHQQCPNGGATNIKQTTYDAHLADPDEPWFCPSCRKVLPLALKTFREFTDYRTKTEEFKTKTHDMLQKLQSEIELLRRNGIPPAVPTGPGPVAFNIQAEIKEALEKESKRLNLVIVGYPEADPSSTRSDADRQSIEGVCSKLGILPTDVSDVFRSGKMGEPVDGRPFTRVTKVKFTNSDSRGKFLRGFLSHRPEGVKYYVRPDMTYRERVADRELKDALYLKRDVSPDTDWIIRGGKIIKRPPKSANSRPEPGLDLTSTT